MTGHPEEKAKPRKDALGEFDDLVCYLTPWFLIGLVALPTYLGWRFGMLGFIGAIGILAGSLYLSTLVRFYLLGRCDGSSRGDALLGAFLLTTLMMGG